jgi:hypothetical protein
MHGSNIKIKEIVQIFSRYSAYTQPYRLNFKMILTDGVNPVQSEVLRIIFKILVSASHITKGTG